MRRCPLFRKNIKLPTDVTQENIKFPTEVSEVGAEEAVVEESPVEIFTSQEDDVNRFVNIKASFLVFIVNWISESWINELLSIHEPFNFYAQTFLNYL